MASLPDSIAGLIDEYFTRPLQEPGSVAPYNWVNTLAFALLALGAAWLILKALRKLRVHISERFFWAVIPFVFFGGALRVVVDAQILPREVVLGGVTLYPFVTPGIYLLTFAVLVGAMAFAWLRARRDPSRTEFTQTLRNTGVALALLALLPLLPLLKNFYQASLILALAGLGALAFEAVARARKTAPALRGLERLLVLAQAFDGAATFVGVSIGVPGMRYAEQHVVGNLVFQTLGGPLAFYALKVLFALLVVEVLRRELHREEEQESRVYLLLLITILGLAPGTRDFLRIAAGV